MLLAASFSLMHAMENAMSENVTLDRIEFEKLKQQAKATRVAQLRRYGIALGMFGSKLHAPAIAVAAILFISLGAKVLLFPGATAEASAVPVLSSSWPLP